MKRSGTWGWSHHSLSLCSSHLAPPSSVGTLVPDVPLLAPPSSVGTLVPDAPLPAQKSPSYQSVTDSFAPSPKNQIKTGNLKNA